MNNIVTFEIRNAVDLTGRLDNSGQLEIVAVRDTSELVDALVLRAEQPVLRLTIYDFMRTLADGSTELWQFMGEDPWQRNEGAGLVWVDFSEFSDTGDFTPLTVQAHPQGQAAQAKPKPIYIKIEPVGDAPERI